MLTACKRESKHNGFVLQRFNVVNNQLNSIIKGIKDSAQILKFGDDVILLVLRMNDSVPEFCFASTKKKDINEEYIYRENRRIVGYIVNKSLSTEIIVLSNLNSSVDFGMIFYKFLVPTVDKKCFDYIYFPDNQYTIDARGFGPTPPVFDPYYYFYTYKENRIIPEYFER
jgi:hypothetical protein